MAESPQPSVDWRVAEARLAVIDEHQQAQIDHNSKMLEELSVLPTVVTTMQKSLDDLRKEMFTRFDQLERAARQAASDRARRYSVILATAGAAATIAGVITTILKAVK